MAEHFCRIEWNQEGFQAVRVYDGASLSPEERDRFCRSFAEGMWDRQTVDEIDRLASDLANALGCRDTGCWSSNDESTSRRPTFALFLSPRSR